MTDRVPTTEIEHIVGYARQRNIHIGRIVPEEDGGTFYILHSQECKDSTQDLRNCVYSRALDHGLFNIPRWRGFHDMPVSLMLDSQGRLTPVRRMGGLNVN